jgi:putative flippase GtrA
MEHLLKKLYGYFITAGTAAIIDIGGFNILYQNRVNIYLAASVSFIVAAIVNYQLTSRFVFNTNPSKNSFYKFFSIALLGMAINVLITVFLINVHNINPMLSKLIAIGIAFFVNFYLNLKIVFTTPKI